MLYPTELQARPNIYAILHNTNSLSRPAYAPSVTAQLWWPGTRATARDRIDTRETYVNEYDRDCRGLWAASKIVRRSATRMAQDQ